jgi:hypothetical protein
MAKKDKKFAVGDRVVEAAHYSKKSDDNVPGLRYHEDDEYSRGTVVAFAAGEEEPGEVNVQWDRYSWESKESPLETHSVPAEHLITEAEFNKQYSKLEAAFKSVQADIKSKMKDAAKLLKDANKLAKKTGCELAEMDDAIQPLLSAMDATGWNTSSFFC